MRSTAIAAAAVAALVPSVFAGNAVVVNKCDFEVYLQNTPSMSPCTLGGSLSQTDSQTLSANGGTYTVPYSPICNNNGWAVKLSNESNLNNQMQFEYTLQQDATTVWIDMSEVDGDFMGNLSLPWDFHSDTCGITYGAYIHWESGIGAVQQSCDVSADVTLTLCNETTTAGSGSSSSDSGSSSSVAISSRAAVSSSTSASSVPTSVSVSSPSYGGFQQHDAVAASSSPSSSSSSVDAAPTTSSSTFTTLISTTSAVPTTEGDDHVFTVTQMATAFETAIVTAVTYAGDHHHPRDLHRHHAHGHA